ncbi:hypothetical protein LZ198_29835 [Myxococcus sp. K15C18031901]|uniref:hypothetical protein n=1 Tax=Myxococcus dinghuensis TaxID=2906761 RepID=UPI0020A79D70|nr:hypothetical protein [Myxococcus dinghuensis]MCP3103088.1 hypothetical protein [Myxococcus dinghuensis]
MPRNPFHPRSRRTRRGFVLLLALGLLVLVTAAVMMSLRAVSTESQLQAHERRAREAFFAAEAGMAEARVILQVLMAETDTNYSNVMMQLGNAYRPGGGVDRGYINIDNDEPGLPNPMQPGGFEWYEVLPWTQYTLARGTAVLDQDMKGPDGSDIVEYPNPTNVRYRVFLADDDDDVIANARRVDSNNQVWLVAVGEVRPAQGQPYRTIIRSLVTNTKGLGAGNCTYGVKMGCNGTGTASSAGLQL